MFIFSTAGERGNIFFMLYQEEIISFTTMNEVHEIK